MNLPKKELGQHWLHDRTALQSIVDAADLTKDDFVLEIGPGLGTLTELLAQKAGRVLALEFDRELIKGLEKKFQPQAATNVVIQHGDIRTFNYRNLPKEYKIVANIPYYLTSYLIRSISDSVNPPAAAVLLVQKEVAERLCAHPGKMSILATTAQFYFECELRLTVPAALFTPPPKVDSQVVILKKRHKKLFDVDEKTFFRVIKAGFSEKRKTLRNSLSGGLQMTKSEAEELLNAAQVSATARAQELSAEDWHRLYTLYNEHHEPKT